MSQRTQGTDAPYLLGHSEQELERLTIQARLYDPFTEQVFRAAGLTAGMRVLDVGCGSGDVSFLAAPHVGPTGEVVGVDRAPVAVATACRRAQELHLANAHFLVGDADAMAFEEKFDAVVGRFVLMHNLNPSELLRLLAVHVRPGGLVIFQEPDWSGCRSLPPLPTWGRCWRWISASMQGSGADPSLGLRLFATFTAAGLPPPVLWEHAVIASGTDHLLYAHAAEFVRAFLPALEQLGIATAGEVEVDTLATRLRDEAIAAQAAIVWQTLVGAASRKPTEQ